MRKIRNEKNPNPISRASFSALHHAVIKKNFEICQLLLNHKEFDCTVRSYEGCSALMIAIIANVDLNIIKLLITKKPSLVTVKNNEDGKVI